MDDRTWEFFCNNSPRLVKKSRSKTPIKGSSGVGEGGKIMLVNLQRKKRVFKASELNKSTLSSIYINLSPIRQIVKSNSKVRLKPIEEKSQLKKKASQKSISPIKVLRRTPMSFKNFQISLKEIPLSKQV